MISCTDAQSLAEAARDQELDAGGQTSLQSHLHGCVPCQQAIERDDRRDQELSAALLRSPDLAADDVLFARAVAAAMLISPPRSAPPPAWWRRLATPPSQRQMRWLALAASLALLAFFSMAGMGLRHSHQPASPAPDPTVSSPSSR